MYDRDDPAFYNFFSFRKGMCILAYLQAACLVFDVRLPQSVLGFFVSSLQHMRWTFADLAWWSQRWLQLGYEWAKLLWSQCLWRAPFSRRGEPKLNKYLLHPVCIKGLHTWLWRQSDFKQGGVAQPALTSMSTLAHTHILQKLAIKIFFLFNIFVYLVFFVSYFLFPSLSFHRKFESRVILQYRAH